MIERKLTTRLLEDLSFFPAVAIVGPRQVGKTTLAKHLQTQISTSSIYIDLENPIDQKRFVDDDITFLSENSDKCIIIDEIQVRPQLFTVLRPLIDQDRRPGRFILLGSSSPLLMRHAAETLAGRITYEELTPFSLTEVESTTKQEDHWFYGGFPPILNAKGTRFAQQWVKDYIRDFVYRDLRTLGYDLNPDGIRNLLMMIAGSQSGLLNISDLSRSLQLARPTIMRHLDILEHSFLISRLQPYSVNISKRLVKSPKIYLRDTGLLHTLLEIKNYDSLLTNIVLGGSWEGYVVEQIKRVADPDWQFFFYRTQNGAEADLFAITSSGKKICVEIKFSLAPTIGKGFFQTLEDLKPDKSYVIIPKGISYSTKDNITVLSLLDFLKREIPLLSNR